MLGILKSATFFSSMSTYGPRKHNKKGKSFVGEKSYIVFLKTSIIDSEPFITVNYSLHWLPLLVGIMESQLWFHQTNLEAGFSSSVCGVEEMCSSIWKQRIKGGETHLIILSLPDTIAWLLRTSLWLK